MSKIQIRVLGVSSTKSESEAWILLVGEVEGTRRVPIVIGKQEAQSIAAAFYQLPTHHVLIHDLNTALCAHYDIKLQEVYIKSLKDEVFETIATFEREGNRFTSKLRTSDAIALAVRADCPIFIEDSVIDFTEDYFANKKENSATRDYREMSIPELETALNTAVDNEQYEQAAKIRDEIKRRTEPPFLDEPMFT